MPTIPWTTTRTAAAGEYSPAHAAPTTGSRPPGPRTAGPQPAGPQTAGPAPTGSPTSGTETTRSPTTETETTGSPAAEAPAAAAGPQVMASRFVLTSARHSVTMLRTAMAVRRALLSSPGALGVSLVAHPLRREYWTLSAWTDRAALDAFVGHPVHREAMRRLGPIMADAQFVFWSPPAGTTAPSWTEARERVAASRSAPRGDGPARP